MGSVMGRSARALGWFARASFMQNASIWAWSSA